MHTLVVQAAHETEAQWNVLRKDGTFKRHGRWASIVANKLQGMLQQHGLRIPKKLAAYVKRWHQRHEQLGRTHRLRKPKSGRPRKVPRELALELGRHVVESELHSQRQLRRIPRCAEILNQLRLCNGGKPLHRRTLWRAIYKANPKIAKCRDKEFKPPLTPAAKLLRMRNGIIWLKIFSKPGVPLYEKALPPGAFPSVPAGGARVRAHAHTQRSTTLLACASPSTYKCMPA
jgi:hypothetical protein